MTKENKRSFSMNEIQGCVCPLSLGITQMARSKVSLCHWRRTITDARVRSRQALYMEMNVRRRYCRSILGEGSPKIC